MQLAFGTRSVLCLVLSALPLAAQNASLAGTVTDQQGGFIPNTAITLTSADTGVSQSIKADGSGNFEFPTVRPATTHSRQSRRGFKLIPRPELCSPSTIGAASIS